MKVYKEDKKLIEARKWFIVGAYLSGSPVGKISDDIGLSPGYVSRIVANFKKTGSPSVSQRTHRKGTL
jgi:transposase